MRKPGIEPGAQRWQRWILPLNHLRLFLGIVVSQNEIRQYDNTSLNVHKTHMKQPYNKTNNMK